MTWLLGVLPGSIYNSFVIYDYHFELLFLNRISLVRPILRLHGCRKGWEGWGALYIGLCHLVTDFVLNYVLHCAWRSWFHVQNYVLKHFAVCLFFRSFFHDS